MLRQFMESDAPAEKSEDDMNPYMKGLAKEDIEEEKAKKAVDLITRANKKPAKPAPVPKKK